MMNGDSDVRRGEVGGSSSPSVFGNTFDDLPLSDIFSPPPEKTKANDEDIKKVNDFKETFKHLETLARMLVCTKCEKLPKGKVWGLGCCLVKYCEPCAKELAGRECVACGQSNYPKDAKPDLFSSTILSEIPAVYTTILQLEEMGIEEDVEGEEMAERDDNNQEQMEFDAEKEEECVPDVACNKPIDAVTCDPYEFPDEENDVLLAVCTPKPNSNTPVSQDFPDVMEETPHNKTRGRRSLNYGSTKNGKTVVIPARALAFSSQEPVGATNGIDKEPRNAPSASPEKSDEELFRSPPCKEASSPSDIPSLTPYHGESKEKLPSKSKAKRKNKNGRKFGGRSSDERGPPALTPHKINDGEMDKEKAGIETKRRSVRGRKKNVVEVEVPDRIDSGAKSDVDTKSKAQTNKTKTLSITSGSERKRRMSSTSAVSSSDRNCAAPRGPLTVLDKRNAKGETTLHVACRGCQLDRVRSLIDAGFDVNAKDHAGWTPTHEVINGKGTLTEKVEVLRLLCERGSDVNALGGFDYDTPLHSAAQIGADTIVEVLLEFGASPNIRNSRGLLPKDQTFNEIVAQLLEDKMTHVTVAVPSLSPLDSSVILNTSTTLGTTSMVEEDPAVMKVMLKKAVVFFNYKADPDIVQACKDQLTLKVSDKLTTKVTHVIHQFTDEGSTLSRVLLSMEYLYGLAHCMWQVSSDWITESLKSGACVVPTPYEIVGHYEDSSSVGTAEYEEVEISGPGVARMNREFGNPGLLDGFCFYLYKTCSYMRSEMKLNKRHLADLIVGAGGIITNRDPNPDTVDPLEAPSRFHVFKITRGEDQCSEGSINAKKLELTTHIILFDEKSPPPPAKRYNMEHVKSLRIDWLIDSLVHFRLEDPEKYL